jgi:hypothetical protein
MISPLWVYTSSVIAPLSLVLASSRLLVLLPNTLEQNEFVAQVGLGESRCHDCCSVQLIDSPGTMLPGTSLSHKIGKLEMILSCLSDMFPKPNLDNDYYDTYISVHLVIKILRPFVLRRLIKLRCRIWRQEMLGQEVALFRRPLKSGMKDCVQSIGRYMLEIGMSRSVISTWKQSQPQSKQ